MPFVTWFKDGKRLVQNSRIIIGEKNEVRFLEISEALIGDAGTYKITLGAYNF
jgi:Immunoglobulin I-set domain